MKLQKMSARWLVALALTGLVAGQVPFVSSTAFAAPACGDGGDSKIFGIESTSFVLGTGAILLGYGIYSSVTAAKSPGSPSPEPTPTASPVASPAPVPAQ